MCGWSCAGNTLPQPNDAGFTIQRLHSARSYEGYGDTGLRRVFLTHAARGHSLALAPEVKRSASFQPPRGVYAGLFAGK